MKHQLLLLFHVLSCVCFGQIYIEEENAINFKDIIEIKGLMYFKADTTMVTGRVVRYNKKNKAKRYVDVVEGKPQHQNWLAIPEENDYMQMPKKKDQIIDLRKSTIQDFFMQQDRHDYQSLWKMTENNKRISDNIESSSTQDIVDEFKPPVIEVPKDGLYEEHYDHSILRQSGNYVDGKKQGLWKEWYENGQLMRSVVYLNGKKEGLLETYHPNGQLQGRVNYLDGKEEGRMMVYNDKGEITLVGFFKEGIQAGEWFYYEDGKLILTENYD